MTLKELELYLQNLPNEILPDAADLVSETATAYYQETFSKKAFDGNPWAPAKTPKARGSLLIDSGALMNSIRPLVVTPERVVIAAGNNKVTYARIHNEGFSGEVKVPAHIRKTKKYGDVQVREHQRMSHVVKRQFVGESKELNRQIKERLQDYLESKLK